MLNKRNIYIYNQGKENILDVVVKIEINMNKMQALFPFI